LGFDRLSLGLQSTFDIHLTYLGRIHGFHDFHRGMEMARKAGFSNISADLIFGFPGLDLKDWNQTLERVLAYTPEHLSCYSLEVEEGTPLAFDLESGHSIPTPDEEDRRMYDLALNCLTKAGYLHYEISSFARPGFESRHNTVYWTLKPYIGLGAGAHSFFNMRRWGNHPAPERYIQALTDGQSPVETESFPLKSDLASEFMFLGLRMLSGIDRTLFASLYGTDPDVYFHGGVQEMVSRGLMEEQGNWIRLSRAGLDLANVCMSRFA
ncbi:MAG TPA: coproporphyrinogen III oxidase, partial [Clostridiales bacterium]|nr:coproporphyrinogen III oxidase [Clostridiales bacterium]